jgi:hypothetical protein
MSSEEEMKEEIIIPTELKTYLKNIVDSRFGYRLGDPWKYSDESLGVVVPILRENSPDRQYVTMYEVLKELNIQDTGEIDQLDLQNKSGVAIFIRAGTIFTGGTQSRASQHSGVFSHEKETINVRCVNASHGIRKGEEMVFGDIAPPSVTRNLMARDQHGVWNSVSNYTTEKTYTSTMSAIPEDLPEDVKKALNFISMSKSRRSDTVCDIQTYTNYCGIRKTRISRIFPSEGVTPVYTGELSDLMLESVNKFVLGNNISSYRHDTEVKDLLSKIRKNQSVLDDMMQKVPLFDNQVGAIIFDPVGVIAVETFDSPKSWESIKKEIIEKYGDKIRSIQSNQIYELKPDMILSALKKFIKRLETFNERIIRKDDYSETREVTGDNIIGEYTLIKGQPIHVLLLKSDI